MSRTRGQDGSEVSRRPLLTDAPDWFNRARARTNQRLVFQPLIYQPQPVPLPRPPSPKRTSLANLWTKHQKALLCSLPIAALPIVFAVGFWTRGIVAPTGQVSGGEEDAGPPAAVVHQAVGRKSLEPADRQDEKPAAVQVVADVPPRPNEVATAEKQGMLSDAPPMMPRVQLGRRRSGPPGTGALRVDDPQSWGLRPEPDNSPDSGDGFSLRMAGDLRHVSAEVIRPARAWFATAANDDECTTGTCPVPVARLDRRLNTALEWSPTPQAAAEQAEREGKLVFLIHVSGNFAQPGFT